MSKSVLEKNYHGEKLRRFVKRRLRTSEMKRTTCFRGKGQRGLIFAAFLSILQSCTGEFLTNT